MKSLNIKLPASLHKKARDLAKKEKTSINQLVSSALAEKISALTTEDYIELRAKRASKEKFRRALSKVKNVAPPELDRS